MDWQQIQPFLVALAIGLLLGFERERSHHRELSAGSRSFALLALAGAVAASFDTWAVVVGLVVFGALLAFAYFRTSDEDPGTTTEIAALVAYLLGALAYSRPALSVALAVIVVGLLISKTRIHRFARKIVSEVEMEDAIKFFVVAFVVLPLLPDQPIGPYGVLNPAKIWLLVVLLTGIGWVGYIGVRALGPRTRPARHRLGRRFRLRHCHDRVDGQIKPNGRWHARASRGRAARQPRHLRATAHRARTRRHRSAAPALAAGLRRADRALVLLPHLSIGARRGVIRRVLPTVTRPGRHRRAGPSPCVLP